MKPSPIFKCRRSYGVAALFAALLLAPFPIVLAAPDAKTMARAKLVEGAELLKNGEYEAALGRFKDAYAVVPSPKIHYNFGLAYRGLGRNAEALQAFERFLEDAPDATADLRVKAARQRDDLKKKVVTLEVTADTAGAAVTVDGRALGTTPLTRSYFVDAGPHQLVVEKGGRVFAERIEGAPGQKLTFSARLSLPSPSETQKPVVAATPKGDPEAVRSTAVLAPPPKVEPATDEGSWRRPVAYATAGAAVLSLALGIFESGRASEHLKDFRSTKSDVSGQSCGTELNQYGGPPCKALYNDWRSAHRWSLVGFVGGGLLATAAAGLFLWPTHSAESSRLACGTTGVGIFCGAGF